MTVSPQRDAERSKEAILEAAANLFAEHGFSGTSVQQIAVGAGVARGTPNYFFTSKEKLFQATLERECQSAQLVVPDALSSAGEHASPETLIHALIDVYLGYLHANPRFLRLIQWTALQRPQLMNEVEAHWQTVLSAVEAVSLVWQTPPAKPEVKQLTLSVMGVCTFPFFFGSVIAGPLELQPDRPSFLAERKAHLKVFLTAALRGLQKEA